MVHNCGLAGAGRDVDENDDLTNTESFYLVNLMVASRVFVSFESLSSCTGH